MDRRRKELIIFTLYYRMGNDSELNRFLTAQEKDYPMALAEMRRGKKQSHWM